MDTETSTQSSPLLKSLASSNSHTRREAVAKLQQYLRSHGTFTQLDHLKLWKGLYYCMWMSDRPRAQQQLARELAGLVRVIREENVFGWIEAFWKTMAREWNNIDALRMNKFLYLIRQYLYATFQHLARLSWSDAAVAEHLAILSSIPLNREDDKIPYGLRYHVMDIYVDELDHVDPDREGNMPVETLLQPLADLSINSPHKILRTRAADTLADERLKDWKIRETDTELLKRPPEFSGSGQNEDGDDDDEWEGLEDS